MFAESVYFLVHYRSCFIMTKDISFGVPIQLPAFPQEVRLSIPLISYMPSRKLG